MKVLLITHGKVNPNGHNGISRVVYNLNKYQKAEGIDSEIWSVVDGVKESYILERGEGISVKCFPRVNIILGSYSEICRKIIEEKESIDVVHFHMPWLLDKLAIARICRRNNIPYIVTGHSAYSRSQKQTWKMKIGKLYEIPFLNKAAVVHAITREEITEFRKFGILSDIVVIPNSIEDPCLDKKYVNKKNSSVVKFFFMGELRNQKNIDGLIKAVSLLEKRERENLEFLIAGPDSNDNMNKLKKLAEKLSVEKNFIFLGGVFGDEREKYFQEANVYITPSLSEVISLSAIEAMAYGLPGLFTRQSDVSYYYNENFFEMCESDYLDLARGIRNILTKKDEWGEMGKRARKVYENSFNWNNNVKKFIKVYKSVIKEINEERI